MAVTRIKNNQITDSTITAAKIASGTLTGGLFAADITLASNVTITGNLTITGSSDSISATNTYVNDPLVVFNNGYVASPTYDIGILVNRNLTATAPYGSVNAAWIWRESDKAFEGLMTTETGTTTGSINNSGFANLKVGNITANSLTLTTGTFSSTNGITGTPISGSTGYFTVLQGTAFSTANAVISGGYISALSNITATTAGFGTSTSAVLNATAGNITVGFLGSLNTANAVITGGYINSLANLTATTAQATNFSSGNINFTGTTAGTVSTANVAIYQQLATTNVNANLSLPLHDKTTGNAATLTSGNIVYNPFTNTIYIGAIVTNGGTIGSTGGFGNATVFSSLHAVNFSSANVVITGGYISALSNITATTANFGTSTSAVLNATAGNITTGYFGSLNTANAVITGGSATGLTNFSATTAQATNFSSGNINATGTTAGTWSTANVSLFDSVTALTTNQTFYPQFSNLSTSGNSITGVNSSLTYNPSTGALTATSLNGNHYGTTAQFTNFSTGNAVVSGGYISALSNITATTANFGTSTSAILNATAGNITTGYFGSLNTANAVITGGYVNGLANLTATTAQATNFSSGNAVIAGGYISAMSNITSTTAFHATTTSTVLNSTAGNVTVLFAGGLNTANAVITGGYVNGLANLTATTAQATNFSTGNAVIAGGYISALTNATITTATVTNGVATTLVATNFSSGNALVTGGSTTGLTNFSATTAFATNFSSGNARITGGYADNYPIGANTRSTGAFTTLTASGVATLTSGTGAINPTTGALQVTGGVGISGNLWVGGLTNIAGNVTIGGNLTVNGNSVSIGASTLSIQDPIISLNTPSDLTPLTVVTTADIGIKMHFYDTADNAAFLGRAYDTGYLEWYAKGDDTANVFTGTNYGTIKSGGLILANARVVGGGLSANTGTMQVYGDGSVSGNLFVGGNLTPGNVSVSMTTGTVMGNVGSFNNLYGTFYGTLPGGTDTANVSLYQRLANGTSNQSYFIPFYDKATGNAAAYTNSAITFNPSTGILFNTTLSATNATITTMVAPNFSSANAVIAGGYISSLTNATITTATVTNLAGTTTVATNFSSGNARITGGSVSGLANLTVTTAQATNFSTGNAVLSGGYISAMSNITATTAFYATTTSTTLNATAGNITTLYAGGLNTANAVVTGGYINSLANLTATTAQATNFSTGNALITGGTLSGLTAVTATTGNFGTATAAILNSTSGNVTTLYAGGFNTANAVITGGSVNSTNIGSTTAASGWFTTLYGANFSTGNAVISGGYISSLTNATITTATVTNLAGTTTVATNFSSGNAQVTGGSTTGLTNFSATTAQATNFSSGNIHFTGTTAGTVSTANVSLYESVTATTTNGTFFPIMSGIATGNTASFTASTLTLNPSTGLLSATTFSGAGTLSTLTTSGTIIASGNIVAAATTSSTSTTTGALVVRGGAGIAGDVKIGTSLEVNSGAYGNVTTTQYASVFGAAGGPNPYSVMQVRSSDNVSGMGMQAFTGTATLYASTNINVITNATVRDRDVYSGGTVSTIFAANGAIINTTGIASTTTSTGAVIITGTGGLGVGGAVNIGGNVYADDAMTINGSKTAGQDFIVRGKTDNTLIWARPGASYDQVVIGNSATTSTLVTGAKLIINSTDSMLIPAGTTAQRPSSTGGTDTAGMLRFNSTSGALEYYNGTIWASATSLFTTVTDTQFNGDGGTITFTSANFASATTNGLIVSINGVVQIPSLAYSLSGSTITFTEAPATGDVIDVRVLLTTSAVTAIASSNGFMSVGVDNNGVYLTSGAAAATNRIVIDTAGNINISGNIIPSANAVYNLGNSTSRFGTIYGVSTSALYADLAENYQADRQYNPGTVLMFGGTQEVTMANVATTAVAGIVSTNPAHLMNGQLAGTNVTALALVGRVPCMVIGPVSKGDMMISAGFGYARASASPQMGQVIGKALQDFPINAKGVIEVVVGRM